jgi:hypothetical protein
MPERPEAKGLPENEFDTGGVIAGHSRLKDGVASLAYDPAIHERLHNVCRTSFDVALSHRVALV